MTGFAPTMMLQHPSRAALSKVWMCDAPAEEAPAEDEKASFDLSSISPDNAAMMETIKGLTLTEAAALIKEVESTFNVGPKKDEEEEAAAAE